MRQPLGRIIEGTVKGEGRRVKGEMREEDEQREPQIICSLGL
jgi:hypothetical protein